MENKLDDTRDMKRPACPFYGFKGVREISGNCDSGYLMEDQGDDRCALIEILNLPYNSSCLMESNKVNWSAPCPFNRFKYTERLKKFQNNIRVFPIEFEPEERELWEGIPLKKWKWYMENIAR